MATRLQALIAKWRRKAVETRDAYEIGMKTIRAQERIQAWESCADDLAAVLTTAPQPDQSPLTAADIDQIIEAIDHFVIGPSDEDGELQAIWQPYIDKLTDLKAWLAEATA